SDDEESGTFALADATAFSVNTVFAQLEMALKDGPADVAHGAKRLGVPTKRPAICSLTLGTYPVSPLEMTRAYATLAARGVRLLALTVGQVTGPAAEDVCV